MSSAAVARFLLCALLAGAVAASGYDAPAALCAGVGAVCVARDGGLPPDGQDIAELALEYLDYPYVWAGASPERGFDCSGLVYYVCNTLGFTTSWRTAADMYSHNGESVEKDELEVGDLLFFRYGAQYVGHVGIYIGDGEFVHCSSGKMRVVISELSEDYYDRNYVGAKRVTELPENSF